MWVCELLSSISTTHGLCFAFHCSFTRKSLFFLNFFPFHIVFFLFLSFFSNFFAIVTNRNQNKKKTRKKVSHLFSVQCSFKYFCVFSLSLSRIFGGFLSYDYYATLAYLLFFLLFRECVVRFRTDHLKKKVQIATSIYRMRLNSKMKHVYFHIRRAHHIVYV